MPEFGTSQSGLLVRGSVACQLFSKRHLVPIANGMTESQKLGGQCYDSPIKMCILNSAWHFSPPLTALIPQYQPDRMAQVTKPIPAPEISPGLGTTPT